MVSAMISRARLWYLTKIALSVAVIVILFFSGIFPLEDLFTTTPSLTASIAASDVASLTNDQRLKNGLAPLAVSPLLTEAAQEKAEDMAQNSYYAHVSPDGKTPLYWLDHVGYRYLNAGENLVIDRTSSQEAVTAWMNSPDHRENILRPQFTEIGVGVAKGKYDDIATIFVVQEFGTPYPTRAIAVAPKPKPAPVKTPPIPAVVAAPVVVPTPPPQPASLTSVPTLQQVSNAVAIPSVSTLAPVRTPVATATPAEATATSTSVGQGSTTASFALAPEFYTPVTLTARQSAQNEAQVTAPQAASITLFGQWVANFKAFWGHILHIGQ